MTIEQQQTAVAEYSPTEAALAELRGRLTGVVYDVTTTKGMDAAKKDRAEVRGLRTALEDKRKEIKAPALERCRLIDEEAKRITAALREIEEPIDAQIKAEEARKEAEKAAKAEAERQRVAAIRARIDEIRDYIVRNTGKVSGDIVAAIASLELLNTEAEAGFAEFAAEAEGVKQGTLTKLREMLAASEAQEAEAKRIAEQRAELARQEKEAAERRAAERKVQEEAEAKLRAEREEFERQQAEARRKAEEERAEADRKAAAERAEADRIAREARESEERRLAAERAELERQRQEQEARERAEREKREAEEAAARRREFLASLTPPTAEQIVEVVADHFAGEDFNKAAAWLADIDFKAFAATMAEAA